MCLCKDTGVSEMIEINQTMTVDSGIKKYVRDYMSYEVYLDLETILTDLEKLNVLKDRVKGKVRVENVERISKYVKSISSYYKNPDSKIKIMHRWLSNKIVGDPFDIRKISKYGIDAINYFAINSGHIIEIDICDVCNAINFECMYRDLGYTDDNIESRLEDVGIYGIYDSSLIDFMDKDCFDSGMVMRVEDSPKLSKMHANKMLNYFNTEVNAKEYSELVTTNNRTALNIIWSKVCKGISDETGLTSSELKKEVKAWRVSDDVITFYVNSEEMVDKIIDIASAVSVRVFGRQFKFNSKIKTINLAVGKK